MKFTILVVLGKIDFFSMQEVMDRYYSSAPDTSKNGLIDLNPTPSDLNRVHIQNLDHYRENHGKETLSHNSYSLNDGNQIQSIYKNRARSGSSDNAQDMTKVCASLIYENYFIFSFIQALTYCFVR